MRRLLLAFCLLSTPAGADLAPERIGRVEKLPATQGPHWIWITDLILRRAALVDVDTGRFLGQIDGGHGIVDPLPSPTRSEIYLAETHYSRATRGERTDVVSIWDATTLEFVEEVVIPPKRGEDASLVANSALSDDGRFVAVFNMTPATSVSIVDVVERRFVGEIETPGCSLVYPAGPRRFLMLCSNGAALSLELDESGRELAKTRTASFFDPATDPITEKAVRADDVWLFVSFEGWVHAVDVSGAEPEIGEAWSLLDDADRADGWRIGGRQHLAAHAPTGRLYSLVHEGGVDTHRDPGHEIWVYDVARRERIQRIEVRNPLGALAGQFLEIGTWDSPWRGIMDWLLQALLPNPGVTSIFVTPDDEPLLVTADRLPAISVYDARSGEFLRDLERLGFTSGLLRARPR